MLTRKSPSIIYQLGQLLYQNLVWEYLHRSSVSSTKYWLFHVSCFEFFFDAFWINIVSNGAFTRHAPARFTFPLRGTTRHGTTQFALARFAFPLQFVPLYRVL